MRRAIVRPFVISPVPSSEPPSGSRSVCVKRLRRLRTNWFVMGSVFGVGMSFLMNSMFSAMIIPEYRVVPGGWGLGASKEVIVKELNSVKKEEAVHAAPDAPNQLPVSSSQPPITAEIKPEPAKAGPTAPAAEVISYPRTLALQLGKGQTLLAMLLANHVQQTEAEHVIAALKPKVNPKQLKAGQTISVTLARHETVGDKAAVKELAIKLPNFSTIALERLSDGKFNVAATKESLTNRAYRAVGVVKSSLFQAGEDGHIPMSVMNDLVAAFSYDVDFQRDIHPGDRVEVLMDRETAADGRVGSTGPVRYAALTLRGKKKEIFRFKDSSGQFAWYDAKGNNVKKSLLRTPVEAAHITSGFGLRTHPLLGYTKFHRGVDFGAASGTPIMAAGDGIVEFKGWKTGYGNFVILRHNNTYETAYGHISRFGNINVGSRVKQGQVIAYVGMTGAATGPHLHYEVRKNEEQVNPVSKQFMMANGLTGKILASFMANKKSIAGELVALGGNRPSSEKSGHKKLASRG